MFVLKIKKAVVLLVSFLGSSAFAMTLDWSGGYRFEWTELDRPSLTSPSQRKAYGLNFLYLTPKIIAADGVNVVSRFDILNSSAYPNSQVGELWGLNSSGNTAATTENQGSTSIQTSQLYLNVNQEYGAIILGRAPFEFGLGMTYSAGKGAFDHWYDTRDMIAYKVLIGDWFIMPVVSRKQSSGYGQGGTITSSGFQLQYESDENKSQIGILQENFKGAREALGYSAAQVAAFGGDAIGNSMNIQRTNFLLGRGFDSFSFKFEAGFQTGETGITLAGQDVSLNGYGLASEIIIPKNESKWAYSLKLGLATGDDTTAKDFGGYAFDRNYNVGMMLFNHRLGQKDFLGTDAYKNSTQLNVGNSVDDEFVSNAMYVAPSATYSWSDRLDVRNTLVFAQLMNTVKNSVASSKNLGIELDIELIYKPSERVQWINQLGLLMPGEAFKNGRDGLENNFNYGLESKAAISF